MLKRNHEVFMEMVIKGEVVRFEKEMTIIWK